MLPDHSSKTPSWKEKISLPNGLSALVSSDVEYGTRLSVFQGDRAVFTLVGTLAARVNTLLSVEDEAMEIMEEVLSAMPEEWSDAERDRMLAEELIEKIMDDDAVDLPRQQAYDLDQYREWILSCTDPAQLPPDLPDRQRAEFETWRSSLCALFLAHRSTVHTMLDRHDWIFWLLRTSGVSHAQTFSESCSDSGEADPDETSGALSDADDESEVFSDWPDASLDGELSPVLMTVAYPRIVTDAESVSLEFDRFMQDMPGEHGAGECLVPATLLSYLLFFDPQRPNHPVALQYLWLEGGMTVTRADMEEVRRVIASDGARAAFSPIGEKQLIRVAGERATFRLAVADTLDAESGRVAGTASRIRRRPSH